MRLSRTSRVDIVATAIAELRGIARVGRDLVAGRLPLREIGERLPLIGTPNPATATTTDATTI